MAAIKTPNSRPPGQSSFGLEVKASSGLQKVLLWQQSGRPTYQEASLAFSEACSLSSQMRPKHRGGIEYGLMNLRQICPTAFTHIQNASSINCAGTLWCLPKPNCRKNYSWHMSLVKQIIINLTGVCTYILYTTHGKTTWNLLFVLAWWLFCTLLVGKQE